MVQKDFILRHQPTHLPLIRRMPAYTLFDSMRATCPTVTANMRIEISDIASDLSINKRLGNIMSAANHSQVGSTFCLVF